MCSLQRNIYSLILERYPVQLFNMYKAKKKSKKCLHWIEEHFKIQVIGDSCANFLADKYFLFIKVRIFKTEYTACVSESCVKVIQFWQSYLEDFANFA